MEIESGENGNVGPVRGAPSERLRVHRGFRCEDVACLPDARLTRSAACERVEVCRTPKAESGASAGFPRRYTGPPVAVAGALQLVSEPTQHERLELLRVNFRAGVRLGDNGGAAGIGFAAPARAATANFRENVGARVADGYPGHAAVFRQLFHELLEARREKRGVRESPTPVRVNPVWHEKRHRKAYRRRGTNPAAM